jgi:UPF0271 protein
MSMRTIDLNADLGEGGSQDAALIALVSSANIACGGHAGDDKTMRAAIDACLAAGVAVGAHPGYEDREHFGRRPMSLAPAAVTELVASQLGRFAEIAARAGARVHHVKPHGALYNQSDRDSKLAAAVVEGVASVVPDCLFYAPPAGALAAAAKMAGLRLRAEGFADRRYTESGELVPRGKAGAMIEEVGEAVAQAMQIASKGRVQTTAGTWFPLPAQTFCVHGDSLHALEILRAVRQALVAVGIKVQAQ